MTTGKTLAAHFSYQVVGKSKDGLRLGNLLAENIGYPNMVIAGYVALLPVEMETDYCFADELWRVGVLVLSTSLE